MTAVGLTLRSVRVERGGRCILALDALELPPRGFLGVLGPNGAGKTTLLEVISGLRRPTAGEVMWGGRNLCRIGAWQRTELRRQVGYVPQFQEVRGDLPLTVAEVVLTGRVGPRGLLRSLRREDHAAADRAIDLLGLTAQRRQTFRSLSGGEQRKAMIARAVAAEPRLLLLDEPCSNLDPAWKWRLSAIIDDIFERSDIQVVMVSHELGYLPRAMTELLLLRAGAPVFRGTPEQGLSEQNMRLAFGEEADMPICAPLLVRAARAEG